MSGGGGSGASPVLRLWTLTTGRWQGVTNSIIAVFQTAVVIPFCTGAGEPSRFCMRGSVGWLLLFSSCKKSEQPLDSKFQEEAVVASCYFSCRKHAHTAGYFPYLKCYLFIPSKRIVLMHPAGGHYLRSLVQVSCNLLFLFLHSHSALIHRIHFFHWL